MEKRPTGWPRISDEGVDHVRQVFIQRPSTSISRASAGLQVP